MTYPSQIHLIENAKNDIFDRVKVENYPQVPSSASFSHHVHGTKIDSSEQFQRPIRQPSMVKFHLFLVNMFTYK